jgi:threonine aldolase
MQCNSDNAAAVHPAVHPAVRAADAPAMPYDGDGLSAGERALARAVAGL